VGCSVGVKVKVAVGAGVLVTAGVGVAGVTAGAHEARKMVKRRREEIFFMGVPFVT